jgi:hypothetical protein
MNYEILKSDTPLPDLLDEQGHLRLLAAAEYDALDRTSLRMFCHQFGRYGLPTRELIAWLKDKIGSRKAIEIGSGHGDLAFHLGIPATDSWMQTRPDVAAYYHLTGQPAIHYPAWVEKLEAIEAIKKYKPQVVVGSWITHWVSPHKIPPNNVGSIYGVKEHLIIDRGLTYIMIGNDDVHRFKPIMQRKHESLTLPFLRSRAKHPGLDRVYIWN